MELWDAYDEEFHRVEGRTLIRGEPVPEGLFHLVCDVLVRHTDGTYLLMQRDLHKRGGGLWEATAGGSALQGEDPLACAVRELREETGIVSESLTEVGRVVSPETRSLYVEFLCITDWDKDAITLQEGETISYKWVSPEILRGMRETELATRRMQTFVAELRHSASGGCAGKGPAHCIQ